MEVQTLRGGGECRCECTPADMSDEVTTTVTSLAVAGVVAADVATLDETGMVTVGVARRCG